MVLWKKLKDNMKLLALRTQLEPTPQQKTNLLKELCVNENENPDIWFKGILLT
jgi:hypothetical protein